VLLVVNVLLATRLVVGHRGAAAESVDPARETVEKEESGAEERRSAQPAKTAISVTPFAQVYSSDLKGFTANLRAIGCPEATVKDILTAEVHRRFKTQEDALRPKPADHVPTGWSPRTAEPKLVERRQQASALARAQAEMLREALGYEVSIAMPLYTMTTSDLKVEQQLRNASPESGSALRRLNEEYWAGVQVLQQRTKGFWLPEDVDELQRLKQKRKAALEGLLPQQ
jgi:hypothetical protein